MFESVLPELKLPSSAEARQEPVFGRASRHTPPTVSATQRHSPPRPLLLGYPPQQPPALRIPCIWSSEAPVIHFPQSPASSAPSYCPEQHISGPRRSSRLSGSSIESGLPDKTWQNTLQ